jgi:hypothetical protein
MKLNHLILLALSVGAAGSLSLGTATAHADVTAACTEGFLGTSCSVDVLPGVHCDRNPGFDDSISCTNTTTTGYTVIQTMDCPGGDYSETDYTSGFDSAGHPTTTPTMTFHSADPSVERDSIFVPANDSAAAHSSTCDHSTATRVSYAIEVAR